MVARSLAGINRILLSSSRPLPIRARITQTNQAIELFVQHMRVVLGLSNEKRANRQDVFDRPDANRRFRPVSRRSWR